MKLFDLSGKTALITGASSGLGTHFARCLGEAGASVVLAARRTDRLRDLQVELEQRKIAARSIALDVQSAESVARALDAAGPLDIVINNAGVLHPAPLLTAEIADVAATFDTNVFGPLRIAQAFSPILAANGDRSIWQYKRVLSEKGSYAMTGGSNRQLTEALLLGPLLSLGSQTFGNLLVKPTQSDLLVLKGLCEAGKVKPVIDRRFGLGEVPAAIRYVEDGHARGKVVVTVCQSSI